LILIVLLVYVHIYARARTVDPSVTRRMLRAIQIWSYFFILLAFVVRLPGIYEALAKSNLQRELEILGLEVLVTNGTIEFQWLVRTHRFILSFAVLMTEAFFVSKRII